MFSMVDWKQVRVLVVYILVLVAVLMVVVHAYDSLNLSKYDPTFHYHTQACTTYCPFIEK